MAVILKRNYSGGAQRLAVLLSPLAFDISPPGVVRMRVSIRLGMPGAAAVYICVLVWLLTVLPFTLLVWTESCLLTQMIGRVLARGGS